jgi:hypothetical protein
MGTKSKQAGPQVFRIGGRPYELVEVDGPLPPRAGETFPAQFDHAAGVLRVSRTVPVEQRAWVVAVAVSDACFRLWRPVPVVWPNWLPVDRPARPSARAAGGRARRPAGPAQQPGPAGGPPRP